MIRPLWQLLSEDPSDLTCEESFAIMEYYAEVLTEGGIHLLAKVLEHLRRCPHCEAEHSEALRRLMATHLATGGESRCDLTESSGSNVAE